MVTRKNGNNTSYIWQVKNLKAIEYEQLSPPFTDFQPAVLLAPNEFIYEGYQGNLNDWNSIGKWIYGLVEGRDKLPETTIAEIKEHVTGISDKKEIVKKVYEYMQSRTRYVSIQLGIGGLRPMLASDVDKYGYGDCKALSNYTKALLNAVGVESIYTEIANGPGKIIYPQFASMNQTNHVILCVPLEKDTMWLECTNQISPCGYIGMGNSNRYALLITKQGGKLVKTPEFNKNVNTQRSEITITLDDNGNASFCSSINFRGTNYDQVVAYTIMSEKERRDKIMKELSLKNFALNKLSIENEKQSIPNLKLSLELVAQKYGSVSGNRMFVELNPYNKWEMKTEQKDKRENDIYIPVEFEETDTVKFKLPPSYEIEFLPPAQEFKSEFGHYTMNIVKDNNQIVYIRTLSINQGKFNKDQYAGLSKFFESISLADNSKMLLKKI
ncbi:MAG: DUF3858 domain-containing protein [Bacteroidetes bacterium]|nr:DUF3858 domain-containing protein [Bacteroidota bacterium]